MAACREWGQVSVSSPAMEKAKPEKSGTGGASRAHVNTVFPIPPRPFPRGTEAETKASREEETGPGSLSVLAQESSS